MTLMSIDFLLDQSCNKAQSPLQGRRKVWKFRGTSSKYLRIFYLPPLPPTDYNRVNWSGKILGTMVISPNSCPPPHPVPTVLHCTAKTEETNKVNGLPPFSAEIQQRNQSESWDYSVILQIGCKLLTCTTKAHTHTERKVSVLIHLLFLLKKVILISFWAKKVNE